MNFYKFLFVNLMLSLGATPAIASSNYTYQMIYRSDASLSPGFGCLIDESQSTNGVFEWDRPSLSFISKSDTASNDDKGEPGVTVLNLKNTKSVNIEFDELIVDGVPAFPLSTQFPEFEGKAVFTETDVSGVETVKRLTAQPHQQDSFVHNLWFRHNLNEISNWYDKREFELSIIEGSLKMNGQLKLVFSGRIELDEDEDRPASGNVFRWPYTITCYEDE